MAGRRWGAPRWSPSRGPCGGRPCAAGGPAPRTAREPPRGSRAPRRRRRRRGPRRCRSPRPPTPGAPRRP
ncbi:hypothetical protein [Ornithinimicrobium kibberense]|uniref:hypothetical protein n=1 Tax=Ornithinimicrobium kibberense TaxID=282060 RepID=UPI003620357F